MLDFRVRARVRVKVRVRVRDSWDTKRHGYEKVRVRNVFGAGGSRKQQNRTLST